LPVFTVAAAKQELESLVMDVQHSFEPIRVIGDQCSAVIISEDAWRSIEETLYLTSIPGMEDSIIAGMHEKIEDCAAKLEW